MSAGYVILHAMIFKRYEAIQTRPVGVRVHSFHALTTEWYGDWFNRGARTIVYVLGHAEDKDADDHYFVKETFDEVANLLDARRGETKT